SLPYVSGLVVGTTVVLIAVAAGVVSLLLSVPQLAPALVIGSAAHIAYLAFKIATAPPPGAESGTGRAPSFVGGFLLAVANPKAYLAIAAVFAGTSFAMDSPIAEATLKLAVLTAMIVLIHVFWLTAGVSFSRILRDPVSSRILNILLAAILVA